MTWEMRTIIKQICTNVDDKIISFLPPPNPQPQAPKKGLFAQTRPTHKFPNPLALFSFLSKIKKKKVMVKKHVLDRQINN